MPRIRLLVAVAAVVGLLVGRQAAAIGDVVTSDPDTTQDIYGLAPDDVTIDPAVAPLLADASALSLEDPDPYCMNGYSYQPYMTYQYKTYSIAFGDHHTAALSIDMLPSAATRDLPSASPRLRGQMEARLPGDAI